MLKFLKSLMASSRDIPDDPPSPSPGDPDYHSYLAGIALNEMKMYRAKAIAKAREDPGLVESLEGDVRRAYELYVSRTGEDSAARTAFRETLIRVFAEDAAFIEPLFQKVILRRESEKQA